MDKDIDPAGISLGISPYGAWWENEEDEYVYIQDAMLYELRGFLLTGRVAEFKRAFVEYLTDGRYLYREAASDLLEDDFEGWKANIELLVMLI